MKLVDAHCSHCGSSAYAPYDRENGFDLVKCRGCGLLYVHPRPSEDEISESARMGVHPGDAVLDVTGQYSPDKVPRYLGLVAELFPEGLPAGDWLDIGCGFGEFMVALKQCAGGGLRVSGVDPNRHKVESARARGLDVGCVDLTRHALRYDYVSFLNVYSHLPTPRETLAAWRTLVKPGGELVLETGDTCDLPAWQHPKPYSLPDHLSFASQKIVTELLEELGFEILTVARRCFHASPAPVHAIRQVIKLFVPGRRADWGWLSRQRQRDLWIRARRIPSTGPA